MRCFWRVLKFTGLGLLGVVGLSLILLAAANAAADKQLEAKLAELKAAGQPLSLKDLARKPIPPESNAATYLRRAQDDVKAIEKIVWEVEEGPQVQKLRDAGASEEAIERSESMIRAYRRAIESHPEARELLDKASKCSQYDPQLDYSTDTQTFITSHLPVIQRQRAAFRALRYRALVQLADGQREEAFETCLTMLRLTDHFDENPMLVGHLVVTALRRVAMDTTNLVLQSGPLPESAYEALEKELARYNLLKSYRRALVTERANGLQAFGEIGDSTGYLRLPSAGHQDRLSYIDAMEAIIQSTKKPAYDAQAQADYQAVMARAGTLTKLLAPALEAANSAVVRNEAMLRSLRVLNAILARQQAGQTDEPQLADLGLPEEATQDPYNGKPLLLEKTDQGWTVYSVGEDLKDDGGKVGTLQSDKDRDVGVGPAAPTAEDVGKKGDDK